MGPGFFSGDFLGLGAGVVVGVGSGVGVAVGVGLGLPLTFALAGAQIAGSVQPKRRTQRAPDAAAM